MPFISNIVFEPGFIVITDDGGRSTRYPVDSFLTGMITTAMIEDNAITTEKIAENTVLAIDIAANAVDTSELKALGVTKEKMAWASGKLLQGAGLAATPTEVDPYTDAKALAAAEAGADSAATVSKLLIRDGSGRAKVVAPDAESDIALKSTVTTHGNVKAANDVLGHVKVATASAIDVDASGYLTLTIPNDAIGSEHIEDLDADLIFGADVKAQFRAVANYIVSDAANELMVNAGTILNLAIGGTDVLRVEAAKISLLQDIFTDRWQSSNTNVYIGVDVLGGDGATGAAIKNVMIGYQAGYSTTSGYGNILIGYKAGYATTGSGYRNILIGQEAGLTGVSSRDNVAIGYENMHDIIGADWNVGVGSTCLSKLTEGVNNVAIGATAGQAITTGDGNTCIGREAGLEITTQSYCLMLGFSAMYEGGSSLCDGYIIIKNAGYLQSIMSDNDGDWEIRAAGGKQIDFKIGSVDEVTITSTQVVIPNNELIVQSGIVSFSKTITANQRAARFLITVATPAMDDGYGAVEVDLAVTGAIAGHVAASSAWVSLGGSASNSTGNNICPHSDGIYLPNGISLTNAYMIIGARFTAAFGTNVSWLHAFLFDLNLDMDKNLTSLFQVNDLNKTGFTAGVHSSGVVGSLPFIGTGGSVKYIRLYDTAV